MGNSLASPRSARIFSEPSSLLDVLRIGIVVGLLLVGQADPEPRLVVGGVPLNTLLFALGLMAALTVPQAGRNLLAIMILLLPLHVLAITLLWSPDPAYGSWKYVNLLLCTILSASLAWSAIERAGATSLARIWVLASLVLLVLAIITKLKTGFFNRDTPFFINGPIVFARLMGIAMLLSLVLLKGWARAAGTMLFALAIAWTASKGPMLIMAICVGMYVLGKGGRRLALPLLLFVAVIAALSAVYWDRLEQESFARLAETYRYLVEDGPIPASLESRIDMMHISLDAMGRHVWGVGLGGWAFSTPTPQPWPYPHNLFLEILSESGYILGTIGLLPFVMFLAFWRSPFFLVALFLLLGQLFSGDMLDARYLLFFSLLCVMHPREQAAPGRL